MKLTELRNFITIAESGSIRAAARMRGLTPPALTQSIARLEQELHVALIVRTTRGAQLTQFGQVFLRRAKTILSEVDKASVEMAQMLGGNAGHITVGASVTPIITVLPTAITQFRRDFSNVKVNLVGGIYHSHMAAIRAGEMDFAIGPVPVNCSDADVCIERLFENDLVIVGRKGNPWAKAKTLRQVVDADWLVFSPAACGPGNMIFDAFSTNGLGAPKDMVQCDSLIFCEMLLFESDMLCAIPRQLAQREPFYSRAVILDIAEPLPKYAISLFYRADTPMLPAAAHLAKLLRRHAHYLITECEMSKALAAARTTIPSPVAVHSMDSKGRERAVTA